MPTYDKTLNYYLIELIPNKHLPGNYIWQIIDENGQWHSFGFYGTGNDGCTTLNKETMNRQQERYGPNIHKVSLSQFHDRFPSVRTLHSQSNQI